MAEQIPPPSDILTHFLTDASRVVDHKSSTAMGDMLTDKDIESSTIGVQRKIPETHSNPQDQQCTPSLSACPTDNEGRTMVAEDSQISSYDNTYEKASGELTQPLSRMMGNYSTQDRDEATSHDGGGEGQTVSEEKQAGGERETLRASVTVNSTNNVGIRSTNQEKHQTSDAQYVEVMDEFMADITKESRSAFSHDHSSGSSGEGDPGAMTTAGSGASPASGPKRKPSVTLNDDGPNKRTKLAMRSPETPGASAKVPPDTSEFEAEGDVQLRDLEGVEQDDQGSVSSEAMNTETSSGDRASTDRTGASSTGPDREETSDMQSHTTEQSGEDAEEEDADTSNTSGTARESRTIPVELGPGPAQPTKTGRFVLFKTPKTAKETDELDTGSRQPTTSDDMDVDSSAGTDHAESTASRQEVITIGSSDDGLDQAPAKEKKQKPATASAVKENHSEKGATAATPKGQEIIEVVSSGEDEVADKKDVKQNTKVQPKAKTGSKQGVKAKPSPKTPSKRKSVPDAEPEAESEGGEDNDEEGEGEESEEDEPVARSRKGRAVTKPAGKQPCTRCVTAVKKMLKPAQTAALEAEKQKHADAQQALRERFQKEGTKFKAKVEKEKDSTQESHDKLVARLEAKRQKSEKLLKTTIDSHKEAMDDVKEKLSAAEDNAKSTKADFVKKNRELTQERDKADAKSKSLEKSTKQEIKDAKSDIEAAEKRLAEEKKQSMREMKEEISEYKPGLSKVVKEKESLINNLVAEIRDLKQKNAATELKLAVSVADVAGEKARFDEGRERVEQARQTVKARDATISDHVEYLKKHKQRANHDLASEMESTNTLRRNNAQMSLKLVDEKRANTLNRDANERALRRLREVEAENDVLRSQLAAKDTMQTNDAALSDEAEEEVEEDVMQQLTAPRQGSWPFSGLD